MGAPALLACDWGTTNLRAWVLDEAGRVLAERDFELGVSRLGKGEAAQRFAAEVRPSLSAEGLPAILCGMVGSDLGWLSAPYADCPAGLRDLAAQLVEPEPGVVIVPGVRCRGDDRIDVMRGEETQLFGLLHRTPDLTEGRRVICHPGTHAKWMLVEEGRLVRFVTAMTGELFAVLGRHSVLRSEAPADDTVAFDEGLAAAGEGEALAARLFTTRSRVVGGGAPAQTTSSYLSGLLIGADVAATPRLLGAEAAPVSLLGDARLCDLYRRALAARGVRAEVHDGEAAAVSGLHALHQTRTAR